MSTSTTSCVLRLGIQTGTHELIPADSLLSPPEPGHSALASHPIALQSLNFVKAYAPTVEKAKDTIIQEMESMVISGLGDLVRFEFGTRWILTTSLTKTESTTPFIISPDSSQPSPATRPGLQSKFTSRGRPATEPNSSNTAQWIGVLWSRLERVIEDVANCCIKVRLHRT